MVNNMKRHSICLNGEWDFMPVYNDNHLELPNEMVYEDQKVRVPSIWKDRLPVNDHQIEEFGEVDGFEPFNMFEYPKQWNNAETGLLRCFFNVPQEMRDQKILLRFDAIAQKSRVYLNRVEVANWDEMYLPLMVDVTDHVVLDGENELIVVCTVFDNVTIESGEKKTVGLVGSWFGYFARGIWQDVFLESRPKVYIDDVFITTSVKKMSINTELEIKNTLVKDALTDIVITISDLDKTAKVMVKKSICIKSNQSTNLTLSDSWVDPIFWDIENPHLYSMKIEIYQNRQVVDLKTVTFGFREFIAEGQNFKLNGKRINLRGDSWHFQGAIQQSKQYALNWYKMCKENGVNCIRLHAEPHPEYYLEAADEIGILIVDETAIYGSSGLVDAGNAKYIEMCKNHAKRLVKRDRNHPSVILWSLQNEMRWVPGRDIYKQHIPEMMKDIKMLDKTRHILIEGDNRLISKENTEIFSLHYNIDGTIAQWDRSKPLIFGEHGGWWYICPQNSSMYVGMRAYNGFDDCVEGVAFKERLYIEYCRRAQVSGISTFNFAHYFMTSMPNEDIQIGYDRLDTPGCKPKVIRKNSLTINNGQLTDYPLFKPNPSMQIIKQAFKPITVIPAEYDTSFFDGKTLIRSFDIYNDTLFDRDVKICFTYTMENGIQLYCETFNFIQAAGEPKNIITRFELPKTDKAKKLYLTAELWHGNSLLHTLEKTYKIYPSKIKTEPVHLGNRSIAVYAKGECLEILQNLIPNIQSISHLDMLKNKKYDIVIIGSYMGEYAQEYQTVLEEFTEDGGIAIILEQSKFVLGDLQLTGQQFFSAHIGNRNHQILSGLTNDDFIFWDGKTREETPLNIIERCFLKPVKGDVDMILECSAGDFGDGGDLWTPLFEYGYRKGRIIVNQLEIIRHYQSTPQACLLLRNILHYSIQKQNRTKSSIALIANNCIDDFFAKLGLEYDRIKPDQALHGYEIVMLDLQALLLIENTTDSNESDIQLEKIHEYVQGGGKLLILPTENIHLLKHIVKSKVTVEHIPTYHLKDEINSPIIQGFSICDIFGYDKVFLSPRMVLNKPICENTMEIENADSLLVSVIGTPWYDYFVRGLTQEYRKIALVSMNKEKNQSKRTYLSKLDCGMGCIIVSQILLDVISDKSKRLYSRLLANLGAFVTGDVFSYYKTDKDYAVEHFMTLPHQEYKEYKSSEEYYTDKEYSLNNLGEGLYGWMKKVERSPKDGFVTIQDSRNSRCFFTCFVEWDDIQKQESMLCAIAVNANCDYKLWINGESSLQSYADQGEKQQEITLKKGINRLVIAASAGNDDIRLRAVFKNVHGDYLNNIRYKLTIDEVDPK